MTSKPRSKKPNPKTKAKSKTKAPTRRARASAASAPTTADWRQATLARVRELIFAALPNATEEIKWRKPSNGMQGVPVWSLGGIICTGETYKDYVKLTFAKGASLPDPHGLFNADDKGNTRRAINIREGDTLNAAAFKTLVRAAGAANEAPPVKARKQKTSPRKANSPVLLSGGNPQISKGDGNDPVQAYIDAMPGWKRDFGRHLDALIERAVPSDARLKKAVKWNSPFYGVDGGGWFLALHCFTHYVKVTFFNGASLTPPPPGMSKQANVRYLDVREGEWTTAAQEKQLSDWIGQSALKPGWGRT